MLDFSSKIFEKYRQLRDIAQNNAAYYNNLAEKNSDYLNNENAIKNISFELSKADYSNDKKLYSELKNKQTNLLKEKTVLLNKIGIDEKRLSPIYLCNKCNDTGIYNNNVCDCYKKLYSVFFTEYFNININKLSNFNNAIINTENKKLLTSFKLYCDNFPNNNHKTITLMGKTGTGKTFLSQCILSELVNKNYNVIYISSFNLITILKEYHYSFNLNTKDLLDVLINCDMLIIDDLGSEPLEKNITIEYILNILNERQCLNKHSIFTTNLDNKEIKLKYTERFFDRINDKSISKTFQLSDYNFRQKNN